MCLLRCVVILAAVVHTRAGCQSAWDNREDECWEYEPGSKCPASCQSGFDAVLSTCKEGDDYGMGEGSLFGYKPYALFVEDFENYPDCNLGMTLDTAPCAALFSIMGNNCDYDNALPCSQACQDGLDRTMKKCKVGDPVPAGKYATYNVYAEYYSLLPQCSLGYTPNACDKAISALEEASSFMNDLQCKRENNEKVCSQDCQSVQLAPHVSCQLVVTEEALVSCKSTAASRNKSFFEHNYALSIDCQSKLKGVPGDKVRTAADPPCCTSPCPSGTAPGESWLFS